MAASITTTTIRTEPHRRLRPHYELDEEECSSDDEEDLLLPPPQSWFQSEDEDPQQQESSTTTPHHDADPPAAYHRSLSDDDFVQHNDNKNNNDAPSEIVCIQDEQQQHTLDAQVGAPQKAPSWRELSSEVLPAAARELLSSSMRRVYHYSLVSYTKSRWTRKYSDLGNNAGGYFRASVSLQKEELMELPPFSSLPWIDRQLVQEWRTCDFSFAEEEEEEDEFDRARTLVPTPLPRPKWHQSDSCFECHKPFGPTLLRHHCRFCGKSYCQTHSAWTHKLPHLGYDADVPERVCDGCKRLLLEQNLAERVAWRLSRCRDYFEGNLTPYFETGVDTVEEVARRVTTAAIAMARSIPLGAQAHVAVETVEVLRKHGLKGIYGLVLRKEFMAAADLLCRALGINKTAWPLSVHELSAAIFYALAQHRAMRGLSPEREELIHVYKQNTTQTTMSCMETTSHHSTSSDGGEWGPFMSAWTTGSSLENSQPKNECNNNSNNNNTSLVDETDTYDPRIETVADLIAMADNAISQQINNNNNVVVVEGSSSVQQQQQTDLSSSTTTDDNNNNNNDLPFVPVCEPVSNQVVSSLVFYAPIALNFVYAEHEVDMQLLAAQQGWNLLYAHLDQDTLDRPASALFVHSKQKIACFAVRGTATINDVVTDIRQMPVPFPENEDCVEDDWTPVFGGQGLAVCGMARAAVTLYREHIDSLVVLAEKGYRLRIIGHSLGGGVATLLGALVLRHLETVANLGDSLGQAVSTNNNSSNNNNNDDDDIAPKTSKLVERNDMLKVYGYGTPSCVDAKLSDYVKSFVTTVVLHDDVVPRLTPTSIRGLLKHLLHIRETWVKTHLTNDLMAITERARTVWAPRWRGSFTISKSVSSKKFKRYCRKQIQLGKRKLLMSVKGQLVGSIKEDDIVSDETTTGGNNDMSTDKAVVEKASDEQIEEENKQEDVAPSASPVGPEDLSSFQDFSFDSEPDTTLNAEPEPTRLMLDYMGGIDYRTQGVVIDGDEFFDADDSLLEDDVVETKQDLSSSPDTLEGEIDNDEEENDAPIDNTNENSSTPRNGPISPSSLVSETTEDEGWARFDGSFDERTPNSTVDKMAPKHNAGCTPPPPPPFGRESSSSEGGGLEEVDGAGAVMLDETPLPRMFLPGKIVHIYTHRGGYKAAFVPRAFRELRRISLAGNMLSDHLSANYYQALLELQSVRKAQEGLPRWTAFDEDDTCSCCASKFTWASTSDSEAQEARDKHNCRSCGTLVCHPCSSNRIPLPSLGINVPVRVCDRCYNDMGGVLTGHSGHALTSSFMEESPSDNDVDEVNGLANNVANKELQQDPSAILQESQPHVNAASKTIPQRQRERRSQVVDDLAARLQSASLTGSGTLS